MIGDSLFSDQTAWALLSLHLSLTYLLSQVNKASSVWRTSSMRSTLLVRVSELLTISCYPSGSLSLVMLPGIKREFLKTWGILDFVAQTLTPLLDYWTEDYLENEQHLRLWGRAQKQRGHLAFYVCFFNCVGPECLSGRLENQWFNQQSLLKGVHSVVSNVIGVSPILFI